MDFQTVVSVGNVYQNIAFYTFLALMVIICVELLKHNSKQRDIEASFHNK